MRSSFTFALLVAGASAVRLSKHARQATHIMIPKTCFDSQADFDADWIYNYPWGTDHNGAARMNQSQVGLNGGVLTLTAKPVTGEKPATHGGKEIAIKYLSGTVSAKEHFTVAIGGGYDFSGDFKATTTKGTWPAFWITAVNGWPPEIDMAEWKGSGKISFNTFNTSTQVAATDVNYANPGEWHSIKTEVRDLNGKDVQAKFYMDGKLYATQVGKGYIGQANYLIIDLQMEGSSGSPGPTNNTLYQARNLEVLSYNPSS